MARGLASQEKAPSATGTADNSLPSTGVIRSPLDRTVWRERSLVHSSRDRIGEDTPPLPAHDCRRLSSRSDFNSSLRGLPRAASWTPLPSLPTLQLPPRQDELSALELACKSPGLGPDVAEDLQRVQPGSFLLFYRQPRSACDDGNRPGLHHPIRVYTASIKYLRWHC